MDDQATIYMTDRIIKNDTICDSTVLVTRIIVVVTDMQMVWNFIAIGCMASKADYIGDRKRRKPV